MSSSWLQQEVGHGGVTGERCALNEIPHVSRRERVCDSSGRWHGCVVQL